jgi:two-component system, OmpR family, sensor histidine kinase KdpD
MPRLGQVPSSLWAPGLHRNPLGAKKDSGSGTASPKVNSTLIPSSALPTNSAIIEGEVYLAYLSTVRRDPEVLLRQLQAEEEYRQRGRLKILLGYGSGVGKSFRMLDEGRRRREKGEDVIVGTTQPVTRPEVQALLRKMEVIPFKMVDGIPVMDVDAIRRRRPQVCLVDGLAYDNPPGSRRPNRWQDVQELLAAGISVIAAVNLQYIEERQAAVERVTGKRVKETVPLSFVCTADEIEVVDAPADACRDRESNGNGGSRGVGSRQQQLSELREIALLLAADVVDRQLENYLKRSGAEQLWAAQERILVYLTPGADETKILESGRRNADRFQGELFVAHLHNPDLRAEERTKLDANLALAFQLDARVEALEGENAIDAVMSFARAHCITQIFVGRSPRESWWDRRWGSDVDRLIRQAEGIDVRVFPR